MSDTLRPTDPPAAVRSAERLQSFFDGTMPDGDGPSDADGYRVSGQYHADVQAVLAALSALATGRGGAAGPAAA